MYLPILHLPRVELRCRLQEKLHRAARPLGEVDFRRKHTTKVQCYCSKPRLKIPQIA